MQLHASCVAVHGKGVLIRGASGTGKSSLALQLMGLGATLVADDRTDVILQEQRLHASAPDTLHGLIEARGIGILRAHAQKRTSLDLVVDLDVAETERVPPDRDTLILGQRLPLLHKVESAYFAAALLQYVRIGKAKI